MVAARCKFRMRNSAPFSVGATLSTGTQGHDRDCCFLRAISVDDGNTSIVLQEIKDAG